MNNKNKISRIILFTLLALTGLASILYFAMLSGIGILVHDTVYLALPERSDIWIPLSDDILAGLSPFIFIPIVFLGLWVIASTIIILVLTKKQKGIEQRGPGYPPQGVGSPDP